MPATASTPGSRCLASRRAFAKGFFALFRFNRSALATGLLVSQSCTTGDICGNAMPSRGDQYFNPVTKTRLLFVETAEESGGRELIMDWFVPAGENLARANHVHSGPDGFVLERFELIAGDATCRIGGREFSGSAPYVFEIPANTPHVHPRNAGSSELHVRQRIALAEPSLDVLQGVERFFDTLTALSQKRRATRNGDFYDPLQAAITFVDALLPGTYLSGIPLSMQLPMFNGLASVARRLGYRPHILPEKLP